MLFVLREQEALWSEDFFAFNRTAVNEGRFLNASFFFFSWAFSSLNRTAVNAGRKSRQ
jgi:hypothetical protein